MAGNNVESIAAENDVSEISSSTGIKGNGFTALGTDDGNADDAEEDFGGLMVRGHDLIAILNRLCHSVGHQSDAER